MVSAALVVAALAASPSPSPSPLPIKGVSVDVQPRRVIAPGLPAGVPATHVEPPPFARPRFVPTLALPRGAKPTPTPTPSPTPTP